MSRVSVSLLCLLLGACAIQKPAPMTEPRVISRPNGQDQRPAVTAQIPSRPAPQPVPDAIPQETLLRAALLVPLTGPHAQLGQQLRDAATLAVFDANNRHFSLQTYDTGNSPEGAAAAARKALAEGNTVILGPVFAPHVRAVQPVAAGQNIPVIAFSNDASVAGQNVYLMGLQPQDQVRRVLSYALNHGYDRFGILVPNGPFGEAALKATREALGTSGARLVAAESFNPDMDSMTAAVQRLAKFAPEPVPDTGGAVVRPVPGNDRFTALLIPAGGQQLQSLMSLLAYNNITQQQVKFMGVASWFDAKTLQTEGLQGAWFAGPSPRSYRSFADKYQQTTGKPPIALESIAYDATALAAALAGPGRVTLSPEDLKNSSGFAGIDGIFRFSPYNVAERGMAILEVRQADFAEIDPAPERFYDRNF